MTMGNQPSQQLLLFAQSVLLGLSAGIVYDLLRPFRLKLPRSTHLLDGGYCLAAGTVFFSFILRQGDGELRGFMLLGAVGGAVIFFCTVSQPLQPVSQNHVHDFANGGQGDVSTAKNKAAAKPFSRRENA